MTSQRQRKETNPISDEEVARFLKHLASVYRDKRTGSPLLAEALMRVAGRLLDPSRAPAPPVGNRAVGHDDPELNLEPKVTSYEKLEAEDINRIIQDTTKTKGELIDIAAGRFGIPRSKLLKLPVDNVRDALRSALMHEASLAVITEEAARYGARRQS